MLEIWTQSSGYDLGIYEERTKLSITLPVISDVPADVTFSIISGKLPAGLSLSSHKIIGTAFEVPRTTSYKFVIRAKSSSLIRDRTFTITITGADDPHWLTPSGSLPVGSNNAYYIIDSSFIDFQLSATDTDTAAGQKLNFFIASGEGELPPGLILLPNGRITGFIQPLLEVPRRRDTGFYDATLYDQYPYDFGFRSSNGYDTFLYDFTTYDFSTDALNLRKLNRNYEFIVTITDGDTITKRRFKIYVVGDDFFRADNVIMQAGQGTYTADVTYVRAPVFTTPSYLGLRRANNYQTFKIDIFEGFYNELGPVIYELTPGNATINGLIEQELPNDNKIGSRSVRLIKTSGIPEAGWKFNFFQDFKGATNTTYTITEVDVLGGDLYRLTIDKPLEYNIPDGEVIYLGNDSKIPTGMEFDKVTGELFGIVPYQPAVTERYTFTVKASRYGTVLGYEEKVVGGKLVKESTRFEVSSSRRVFTVDILGEVESFITWQSPEILGTLDVGYPSSLFVRATTTFKSATVLYELESGRLPPGLSLNADGEIVGKVNQLREQNTYKGYWKPNTAYDKNQIVKQDVIKPILSVTRRKNIASVVTEGPHGFDNKSIIKVNSNQLDYNYYAGVEVLVDKFKITELISITGTGPYYAKFKISPQKNAPLVPAYSQVQGLSPQINELVPRVVEVKSTSGSGVGAKFLIGKGKNGTFNYTGLINTATNPILLVEPGSGYLPGETVTISGALLDGVDGINDLTFTLVNGLNFQFKVNGNSNPLYNGTFNSAASTTTTLTLVYKTQPGVFGYGTISEQVGRAAYEAQTQITALNYFNYLNAGSPEPMHAVSGQATAPPVFYKSVVKHLSDSTFSSTVWEKFDISVQESTLTTLDRNLTTSDSTKTTIDRRYTFTVKARDQLNYSATSKTFSVDINIPGNIYYSNIRAQPFLKPDQRKILKDLLADQRIFDPAHIYRYGDLNFGVQRSLSTLVYAGIETRNVKEYMSAMGLNHKPKRFKLGELKTAIATEPGTRNILYEVIYLDLIDPLENSKGHLPTRINVLPTNVLATADNSTEFYNSTGTSDNPFWKRPIPFASTVDRTDIIAGDPGTVVKFPSSISIWRRRIKQIATARTERNYLPLWMRSIQPGSYVELNYVPAVVLCYCKPGSAEHLLLNIKHSGFDFKMLDYTIDRYLIDSVDGYYEDKYLVFKNDRTSLV